MKRILPVILGFFATFALLSGCFELGKAHADTGSGSALIVAGSGGSAVDAAPAAQLHDPVSSPAASWDDMKAAKKIGWATAVFAALVLLGKFAGRFSSKLSWLSKGKAATVVAAVSALAASCYNAAASGGAWTAVLMAGVIALAHYLDAGKATTST